MQRIISRSSLHHTSGIRSPPPRPLPPSFFFWGWGWGGGGVSFVFLSVFLFKVHRLHYCQQVQTVELAGELRVISLPLAILLWSAGAGLTGSILFSFFLVFFIFNFNFNLILILFHFNLNFLRPLVVPSPTDFESLTCLRDTFICVVVDQLHSVHYRNCSSDSCKGETYS